MPHRPEKGQDAPQAPRMKVCLAGDRDVGGMEPSSASGDGGGWNVGTTTRVEYMSGGDNHSLKLSYSGKVCSVIFWMHSVKEDGGARCSYVIRTTVLHAGGLDKPKT